MNKRLVFKLVPVALLAAIGIFWASSAAPRAEAGVSGISATASSVTVTTDSGGTLVVTAPGAILTCTNVACSGNGTSTVSVTLSSASTVAMAMSCGTSVVVVTATQGSSSQQSAQVACGFNCFNQLTAGCGCFNTLTLGCGCVNTLTLGCGVGCANTLSLGCGCTSLSFGCGGCGTFGNSGFVNVGTVLVPVNNNFASCNVGCSNLFGPAALLLNNGFNNCGTCFGGVVGTLVSNCGCNTVLGGNLVVAGGVFTTGCTGATSVGVTVPGTAQCGSTTTVLVTLRNVVGGVVLDGTPVTLLSTLGTLTPPTVSTVGGVATATLLLPANAQGPATITATGGGVSGQASLNVSCAVVPVAPIIAPVPAIQPIVAAPVRIAGPSTGDGGCLSMPELCNMSSED